MNDREKSVLLAKLCGWAFGFTKDERMCYRVVQSDGGLVGAAVTRNLYCYLNMHLAWRVLNWAYYIFPDTSSEEACQFRDDFRSWWDMEFSHTLISYGPAEAQRLWLDKILELAIDAGMVDKNE